jgi:hypothetical protein
VVLERLGEEGAGDAAAHDDDAVAGGPQHGARRMEPCLAMVPRVEEEAPAGGSACDEQLNRSVIDRDGSTLRPLLRRRSYIWMDEGD